jgi:hypothetical protein
MKQVLATRRGSKVAWGAAGLVLAAGMVLPSVHWVGVVVLLAGVLLPFVLWSQTGGSGSWVGLVTLGVTMSALLASALLLKFGCPPPGTTVELKEGKPPVGCNEVRASYLTFSVFFGVVALAGLFTPWYVRRLPPAEPDA